MTHPRFVTRWDALCISHCPSARSTHHRPFIHLFFFFNDTATPEIYPLSLHDALPILYGSAALGGVVNVLTRDIETGFHARRRATAASYANPPHDVWRFRDYTGGEEGLDATGSYGSELVRASVTGGGWHSDGYREQDRRNHWQTAAKLDWRPASATRVAASGSWASDQYETPLIWCTRGGCDDRGQAYQPFMIDTSGRGSFTRSDKGDLTATG